MKVKELIERLQSLDQDLDVYIYNEKEHSLFSVNSVRKTCDYGESENGEDEWEDFVTIFPATNSHSFFALTSEEVKNLQDPIQYFANELKSGWLKQGAISYLPSYSWDKAINNLLTRIKQWQDECDNSK